MSKFKVGDKVLSHNADKSYHKTGIIKELDINCPHKLKGITVHQVWWEGNFIWNVQEKHLTLVTIKGGCMKISEVVVKSAKELPLGCTVRVIINTVGYKKDQLGRVSDVYGENYIKKTESSYLQYIKIGSVDDQNKDIGEWINISNILLVQGQLKGLLSTKNKKFDMTHLDKVILPDGHKKDILEALPHEHLSCPSFLCTK